jgi:hypothetical protein
MHSHSVAEAREAVELLAVLSSVYVPEAYLNDNCLPRAP